MLDRCILIVDGWYASQNGAATDRQHEVRAAHAKVVDPEGDDYLTAYMKSDKARRVLQIHAKTMEDQSFEACYASDAALVRNHLMVVLGLSNNQRSGAVINMTLSEFDSSVISGDKVTILVRHHKTFRTYGHARLVMTAQLHLMLKMYVEHIRPQYTGTSANYVPLFLTSTGEQMSNSSFASIIKSTTGCRDATMTKNRKMAVTRRKTSGATAQEMANLAEHMTHNIRTQHQYYDLVSRVDRSVEVFEQMSQLNTSSTDVRPPSSTVTSAEAMSVEANPEEHQASPEASGSALDSHSPKRARPISPASGARAKTASRASTMPYKHGRRAGYTQEHERALWTLFREEIQSQRVVTADIRASRRAYPEVSECLKDFRDDQVKDKLRVMIKQYANKKQKT